MQLTKAKTEKTRELELSGKDYKMLQQEIINIFEINKRIERFSKDMLDIKKNQMIFFN